MFKRIFVLKPPSFNFFFCNREAFFLSFYPRNSVDDEEMTMYRMLLHEMQQIKTQFVALNSYNGHYVFARTSDFESSFEGSLLSSLGSTWFSSSSSPDGLSSFPYNVG